MAFLLGYFAPTRTPGEAPLESWLGKTPDRPLRARLVLMRQLTRLWLGCILLLLDAPDGKELQEAESAPLSIAELHAATLSGRRIASASETRQLYGRASLRAFLEARSAPQYEKSFVVARSER